MVTNQLAFTDESATAPPLPPRERTSLTDKHGTDEETMVHLPLHGKDDSHSPLDGSKVL